MGRLSIRDFRSLEKHLPQQSAMLAAYCLQVAILKDPSMAEIAAEPETRRLGYWIRRGLLTDIQYRYLAFDEWLLDQVFWARLRSDFYIGYVRLPLLFNRSLLALRYQNVVNDLISLAQQENCQTISTQLINPTFINLFKSKKFKAISPEGVGLPVTFRQSL